jgi:hypothetical protein
MYQVLKKCTKLMLHSIIFASNDYKVTSLKNKCDEVLVIRYLILG